MIRNPDVCCTCLRNSCVKESWCFFVRCQTGSATSVFVSRRTWVRVRRRQTCTRLSWLGRQWPGYRMPEVVEDRPSLRQCRSWNQPTASVLVVIVRSHGVSGTYELHFCSVVQNLAHLQQCACMRCINILWYCKIRVRNCTFVGT